jgi:hypothetical protein
VQQAAQPSEANATQPQVKTRTLEDEGHDILVAFDNNLLYCPRTNTTRLARFRRAQKAGLDPGDELMLLIQHTEHLYEFNWRDVLVRKPQRRG